jgi:hypothetical protein
LGRWQWTLSVVALLAAIWFAYSPSRKHLPHSDQMNFLVDTGGRENFFDLIAHTYSYNRTRITSPGDTPLFRPMFFVWLSGLKAAFGTHFDHCQTLGIVMHGVVCVLLFVLLRRIFALNGTAPEQTWLPFALTLFFALNYGIIEQVVWFNIQAYLLAIALMLGSAVLLLRALPREGDERVCKWSLAGAWLLALIASFTYELGQFFAILAGLFLMVMLPGTRWRRLAFCLTFAGVAVIYQAANQFDRWVHTCEDDVNVAYVLKKASRWGTFEHSGRYVLYTIVQSFVPAPIATHREGKIFIGEEIWYHTLHDDSQKIDDKWPLGARVNPWGHGTLPHVTLIVVSILVFSLWAGMVAVGFWRHYRQRAWKPLAIAGFLFGVWAMYAAMTIFGRMNVRPGFMTLSTNTHYNYMSLIWAVAVSAVALAAFRRKAEMSGGMPRLTGALAIGLIVLGLVYGSTVRRINTDLSTLFYGPRMWLTSLRNFVEEHEYEPDFRFAVAVDLNGQMPHCSWVPIPYILYKQYADRNRAQYVIRFHNSRFEATPIEEWRKQEDDRPRLAPNFVGPGVIHQIFELDDWYYAPTLAESHAFIFSESPADDARFHRDRSLTALTEWVHANTPPLTIGKH